MTKKIIADKINLYIPGKKSKPHHYLCSAEANQPIINSDAKCKTSLLCLTIVVLNLQNDATSKGLLQKIFKCDMQVY